MYSAEPPGYSYLMSFAQSFSGIVYGYAGLFGNATEIDIVLTAFHKICKNTPGRIKILTSIYTVIVHTPGVFGYVFFLLVHNP